MFAFAIWDRRRRRLFAARDRVGKKPFVYAHAPGGDLAFSSELASLVASPGFAREVDETALHHYLTYQFVPCPRTIWSGAKKLPPAHFLVWEGGRVRTERYWDLHYVPKLRLGSLAAYRERFLEIFRESVRLRLVSDVPLGAFLSGGVDSSAVVAMMSLEGAAPVRTFSIGFPEGDYDEVRYARMVAERYGTEHQELVVRAAGARGPARLVRHYGEPFGDSSAVPTWYVSQLTRRSVTVALSGDGGDEAFGGYQRYLADRLISGYLLLPARAARGGAAARDRGAARPAPPPRLRRAAQALHRHRRPERERQYVRYFCAFANEDKAGLYAPAFAARMAGVDSVALVRGALPPRRRRELPGPDPLGGHALLPPRRHPRQGRHRGHGQRAGNPRPVPRPPAPRVRRRLPAGAQTARHDRQVPPQEGAGALPAAPDPAPAQDGLRDAGRRVVPRRTRRDGRRPAALGARRCSAGISAGTRSTGS